MTETPSAHLSALSGRRRLVLAWLALTFVMAVVMRFSADRPSAESLEAGMLLSERLLLVADYAPGTPPDLAAGLRHLAGYIEAEPKRSAVLRGESLSTDQLDDLPEGYQLIAQFRESHNPEEFQRLQSLASAAKFRLFLCLGMLLTLTLSALIWSLSKTQESSPPRPMLTTIGPSAWLYLGLFFAWDVGNLFGVGILMSLISQGLAPLALMVLAQSLGYGLMVMLLRAARPTGGPCNLSRSFSLAWVGRGYFLCYAVVLSVNALVGALRGAAPTSSNPLLSFFMTAGPGQVIVLAVLVVAIGPFFEELMFRGWLLGGLREAWGDRLGLVVSSLLFALIHADLWATPALFSLGLVFGWTYLRSGSLWASVLLHGMWNATTFTFLLANMP